MTKPLASLPLASAMLALRMCGYDIIEIANTAETAILELTEEDDDRLTTN